MSPLTKTFLETKTMTKRNLWKSFNNPDRLMENLIAPIMTMLIFVYVMGGAMSYAMDGNYVNFVVPGILLVSIGQSSTSTAISVSTDIKKGIVDRFRAMPITTFSFLSGHVIESVIRTMFSFVVTLMVAYLVGFRPEASWVSWLLALSLIFLFSITITWIAVAYGLAVKGPEGSSSLNLFVMLFIYLSSGFIPIDTLPRPLQIFAEHQPMTFLIEAIRRLLLNHPTENYVWLAFIWCLGLLVVASVLAFQLYKRKVNK